MITLLKPEAFNIIEENGNKLGIHINQAVNQYNTIKIYLTTIDDHRKITKLLDENKQEFFRRPVDNERPIKAVIKGISTFVDIEVLKDILTEDRFTILSIDRITKRDEEGHKRPMPMVLVQLPTIPISKKYTTSTKYTISW